MLFEGHIPMNGAERSAVDELVSLHANVSFTRRDPGEAGPIVVTLPTGETVTVDAEGAVDGG